MGQLPKGSIDLIQNEDEAKKYKIQNNKKISYVTQTPIVSTFLIKSNGISLCE